MSLAVLISMIAVYITGLPVLVAPGTAYELQGVTTENIVNISTTCGELAQKDSTSAVLKTSNVLCGSSMFWCPLCDVTFFGVSLTIKAESELSIELNPLPPVQASTYALSTSIPIAPIQLPPISNYVRFWPENCKYSFDPPLPDGLLLSDSSIIGAPSTASKVTVSLSAVEIFSKISVPIGTYMFIITEPVPSSSLSPGNIVAIIVGTILGVAVLILLIFIIRQRRQLRQPYDFTNLVTEAVGELATTSSNSKFPTEIARSAIKNVDLLGKGSFGEVYKGIYAEKGKP